MNTIENIVKNQRTYFNKGETLDYSFRKKQLLKLKDMLKIHQEEIYQALKDDLNKSKTETHMTELGFLYAEIDLTIKNLKEWMEKEQVHTPITHKGSKSFIYKEPYGVTLVIAPWNYPLQLAIGPVIGAMAAGNCVVVKPSEFSSATSRIISEMVQATFEPDFITVVEGAKDESQELLKQQFNYIFFTGSSNVGKIVMKAASEHLTPVTLELGGKSPVIVDKDADIKLAAKRIVWGKFTNAGQTCVAPDFLYVHEKVKKKLVKALKKYIKSFYEKKPLENKDYVHIINSDHFNRLNSYMDKGNILFGGNINTDDLAIEPTLIDQITWDDPIMEEEIFGPLLPILSFRKLDDALEQIKQIDKPLAFYYFGNNKKTQERIIKEVPFGGGCINDTLFHLANPHLPFGGVGSSGMGSYHGKYTFDTFSHKKSILKQTTSFDIPLRYPGSKIASALVQRVMK